MRRLQTRFLTLVPRIELHGRIFFRHLRCPQRRADAIAEMLALAWKWFVRLAKRGKDAAKFISTFASLAARAVWNGRRVCGQEKAKDVLSVQAQMRHGFKVESLPNSSSASQQRLYSAPRGQESRDAFEERLQDNTVTPVPEQAAFRIDWPRWMNTRTERDRRIIGDLMAGERTLDVSRKYGLSPGRVSQLRQDFREDWLRFCDDSARPNLASAA